MKAIALKSPVDHLVEDYQEHLIDVAGLQPSTCQKWTFFVRLFLNAQYRPKAPEVPLPQLKPGVLLDFVLQQGEHYRPGHLQSLASALRSFCRFLCVSGRHPQDLSAALPAISGQHREDLPIYLSRAQLRALLEVFDRRTVLGKRDYAMVLCLAGLGLRAGEVSHLSLDDVDWREGWLRLAAPKGRRERRLPLPDQTGRALAAYAVSQTTEISRRGWAGVGFAQTSAPAAAHLSLAYSFSGVSAETPGSTRKADEMNGARFGESVERARVDNDDRPLGERAGERRFLAGRLGHRGCMSLLG
jgi:site-specific recombinase XerD